MNKSEQILKGIKEQNQPASYDGQLGFWLQGGAVFVRGKDIREATNSYRSRVGRGLIIVQSNFQCSEIARLQYAAKYERPVIKPQ